MIKTLTKHGNSYALVIDKPILRLLKIEPDTPIEITTDGQVIILSPAQDPQRRARFEKALEEKGVSLQIVHLGGRVGARLVIEHIQIIDLMQRIAGTSRPGGESFPDAPPERLPD